MNNYASLSCLINELNRTLGITSDTERENLIQSYYNQGLISYRQYYLLRSSVVKHEYIHNYFIQMYGEQKLLYYCGEIVANYKIYCENDNHCEVELNLYYPFNRHRAILSNINVDDVDNAVLDYMSLQAYCDTEDCNKLQAYVVIEYFKSQIGKDGK